MTAEIFLHDLHPAPRDLRSEVVAGLRSDEKSLPCMLFYDDKGSRLFDRICELEEYYPTRTEIGILERRMGEIARRMGERILLIELGSGSSTKTHLVLRALQRPAGYVPIDIARDHLLQAAARIEEAFPEIPVRPVCADFNEPIELPPLETPVERRFAFFPGSTIGNLDRKGRVELLSRVHALCQPEGGGLLIGIDLVKDVDRLEAAYNDASGVTAEFNLNLLDRINRDFGADFDRDRFRHHAFFNEDECRIEMHLVSEEDQTVSVSGERFEIEADETICTEHSYKFTIDGFAALAAEANLELDGVWTDDEDLFAVLLLRCDARSV
jgi:dimethylhistidine N-methyltransferase